MACQASLIDFNHHTKRHFQFYLRIRRGIEPNSFEENGGHSTSFNKKQKMIKLSIYAVIVKVWWVKAVQWHFLSLQCCHICPCSSAIVQPLQCFYFVHTHLAQCIGSTVIGLKVFPGMIWANYRTKKCGFHNQVCQLSCGENFVHILLELRFI